VLVAHQSSAEFFWTGPDRWARGSGKPSGLVAVAIYPFHAEDADRLHGRKARYPLRYHLRALRASAVEMPLVRSVSVLPVMAPAFAGIVGHSAATVLGQQRSKQE
jgi:hypothetical protein